MGKHVGTGTPTAGGSGRHKAEDPADPVNTLELQVVPGVRRRRTRQVAVATGAIALVTATAVAGTQGSEQARHVSAKETADEPIVASRGAHVAHERVDVGTKPAPSPQIVQEPPRAEQNKVEEKPAVTKLVPKKPIIVAPPKAVVPPKPVEPAKPPVVAPPVAGYANGAAIAAAALAQLGRRQDCTKLVTNSLAAVGISHHGWPISYAALGDRIVNPKDALPGDLAYYVNGGMGLAHVAVYIGNGMAVHGGWNGNQTVTFKANVGSGPIFIRVRAK